MGHIMINYKLFFGLENIQLHYMDTDSLIISVHTKDIIKDLNNLEDLFDFSNMIKIMKYLEIETEK